MKKIIIAGGTGFLGQALESYFSLQGFELFILTRNPQNDNQVEWDGQSLGNWVSCLEDADVLINLSGKSVDCRYTKKNKQEILHSRIRSTQILQQAMEEAEKPPILWINASSATIYVHAEKHKMTERNGLIGDDFSMRICKAWEAEFFKTKMDHVRKVAARTSIVLGNSGGAFPKYKLMTQLGFGGHQGNGEQWMSWIHLEDFCRAITFIMANSEIQGPINITAPHPIINKEAMTLLRSKYKRKIGLNLPAWLLELGATIMGTETELLLKSRFVFPEILIEKHFEFKYSTLAESLRNL